MGLRRRAQRPNPLVEEEASDVPGPDGRCQPDEEHDPPSELRQGMRGADLSVHVASDLLAGLLVWMGAGWLLDRWVATEPWFTVIGALVGYAGGLYLVWRRVQRLDQADRAEPPPTAPAGPSP